MIESIHPLIIKKAEASRILDIRLIQELWSGYGELQRITLNNRSVILKLIKFPDLSAHPEGRYSEIGHIRKKKSYEVETSWYQSFKPSPENALYPKHIASGQHEEYQYLILEDLAEKKFIPKKNIRWKEIEQGLSWLAYFHRFFLNQDPKNLWQVGTYWHLETRPQELLSLTDLQLKEAAPLIDLELNQANFKTIVHGDAKLANFLFTNESAAAVDFQYVGGGVGVKDVAYFLSSVLQDQDLESLESKCLDHYFKTLNRPEVEKEWRELYPYAWCDFYRFLEGWSPGHWKINTYTNKMKEKVLKCL